MSKIDETLVGLPREISVFEVGPRDGLQNERDFVPTESKVEFVNRLNRAGCRKIEVTSFVHPRWIPQLRDAAEVYAKIEKQSGVTYNALVPNLKGLELATNSGFGEVVTILSASESHNKNNINRSVAESLEETKRINQEAARSSMRVRSYIATSFGCPFEGTVDPERVIEIALALEGAGSYEISLGDTTGVADPPQVYALCRQIRKELKQATLAVHLHQSDGIEFANVMAALQAGVTIFDSAAGGLGGCPYAPGALGNIATEVLVEMFARMGISTGIDGEQIKACSLFARKMVEQVRQHAGGH